MLRTEKAKALVCSWRKTRDGLEEFARYIACSSTVAGAKDLVRVRRAIAILEERIFSLDPLGETEPRR